MNPIYRPWLQGVSTIGMGDSGWKYEILVRLHIVSLTIDDIEAPASHTVYEHILVDRFLALTEMRIRIGIIAYIGYIEHRGYSIGRHHTCHHLGQHKGAFAGKPDFYSYHIGLLIVFFVQI